MMSPVSLLLLYYVDDLCCTVAYILGALVGGSPVLFSGYHPVFKGWYVAGLGAQVCARPSTLLAVCSLVPRKPG